MNGKLKAAVSKFAPLRLCAFAPLRLCAFEKCRTVLLICLVFTSGFFMRAVIAEDAETDKETALLEAIESKIETKMTSMDDEKQRQDAIQMVGDDIEHLYANIPELSNDTLKTMRAVCLTYADSIAEANIAASGKKKKIEKEAEDSLLLIDESETDLRQQVAQKSLSAIDKVLNERVSEAAEITKKRNENLIEIAPEELKGKVRLFFFPEPDAGDAASSTSQNGTEECPQ